MRWPTIPAATALAFLAISLGACVHSDPAPVIDPAAPTDIRVTLPAPPADVAACFRRAFPGIPDRDLTTADVVRIIGRAKVLDKQKTACGLREQMWIKKVMDTYAR